MPTSPSPADRLAALPATTQERLLELADLLSSMTLMERVLAAHMVAVQTNSVRGFLLAAGVGEAEPAAAMFEQLMGFLFIDDVSDESADDQKEGA